MTTAPRELPVFDGADDDACPLCGIHRRYAGYTVATCGPGLRKPGCFVKPESKSIPPAARSGSLWGTR